ncbi:MULTISPECIES: hypothetical protein [Aeromicrobium]|uniref:hypothetical protein n=1 Tax=Aeromicrobium TaxID=2040 RepID=UPI00257F89A4|nr:MULTISPECIES: hypothetical protein [Aeromicrobium]
MEPILHRDAAAYGLTPKQLRRRSFAHPVNGVAVASSESDDLRTRTIAALRVMPTDAVATHLTAAVLRGWTVPRGVRIPVIVCTNGEAPHLDRRGVYVRRCAIPARHRTAAGGVAIASPEWTVIELAETLSLVDLVTVIDSALAAGHTTVPHLREALVPGRRGVRVLRRALTYCDGRSESAGESALRLVHTLSGIAVDSQVEYREHDGTLLLTLDLRVRGTSYAPEFDGADHRDASTHRRDLRRERLLHRLGIRRAGYTFVEICRQPEEIVRMAAEALGRPQAFSAADARAEIQRSSLTREGHTALEKRMTRFMRSTSPRARA